MAKNIDFQATFIMNNSKLTLIQSISEQQQKADQLQQSLQQLSETLKTFEMTIEQSERPITNSTILLNEVQQTTSAIKSHLRAILTEIGNLSPKAIKSLTASYTEQIDALQTQLANIDLSEISKVKSSIDSFSTSIHALQAQVNKQLQSLRIDEKLLQNSIQHQVQQAIEGQRETIESQLQSLLTEKLGNQRATHILWGMIAFGLLILLIILYLGYQANTNLKTIKAQEQMILQNSQVITNQINYLKQIRN